MVLYVAIGVQVQGRSGVHVYGFLRIKAVFDFGQGALFKIVAFFSEYLYVVVAGFYV